MSFFVKTIAIFTSLTLWGTLPLPAATFPLGILTPSLLAQNNLPADWQTIEGEGVKLALPNSFFGGNPRQDLDAIAQQLQQFIPNASEKIAALRRRNLPFSLIAFDSQLDSVGFLTNVYVSLEAIPANISLAEYLDITSEILAQQYTILEQEIISIDGEPGGRVLVEAESPKGKVKQLFYLVQKSDPNRIYIVIYSGGATVFDQYLPIFEQSIQTFTVSP